jgi:hypothetical protein
MKRRKPAELSIFNFSFLDVFACTVGFLLFILVNLSILSANLVKPIEEVNVQERIGEVRVGLENLKAKYIGLSAKYERTEQRYAELQEKWPFWKKGWLLLALSASLLLLLLMLSGEVFRSPGVGYDNYVVGPSRTKGNTYFVLCDLKYVELRDTNEKVSLSELSPNRFGPFHRLCSSLKEEDRIVLATKMGAHASYHAACRIAVKYGVYDRCVFEALEE